MQTFNDFDFLTWLFIKDSYEVIQSQLHIEDWTHTN